MSTPEREAPPIGEEIHLPGPSLIPIFNALGITLAIVGVTLGLVVSIVGIAIFLVTTIRWIRDTRRDISALPEDHGH
jgi:mannose/fructose/N-acetylgalactosamine-specific phosphotransferase system component IID